MATAEARDEEMKRRIERHRALRPPYWRTIETPLELPKQISLYGVQGPLLLIDDLTLWLANVLEKTMRPGSYFIAEEEVLPQVDALIEALESCSAQIIIVSNEVGMGVVPNTFLGRVFSDLLGLANQRIAKIAKEVNLMWAGIPLCIKAG